MSSSNVAHNNSQRNLDHIKKSEKKRVIVRDVHKKEDRSENIRNNWERFEVKGDN